MNISIDTAQNVSIAYQPAGIANRIFATLIDFALLGSLAIAFAIIISKFKAQVTITIIFFCILSCYHLLCQLFINGRSIGKMVLHLSVVRLDGKKMTFWDILLRWMLRLVDITMTFGIIAKLSIIISKKMQRIGDFAAGTTAIRENQATPLERLRTNDAPEEYRVVFHQVNLLSDKDVSIIREVIKEVEKNKNYKLLEPLSFKIKELTGIQTDMVNFEFIKTVINDYTHLTEM